MKEEIIKKIVDCFIEIQCFEVDEEDIKLGIGYRFNDEAYLITYKHLEEHTKIEKNLLRPVILEMRNDGLLILQSGIDIDGDRLGYLGTGYSLTQKGLNFINEKFPYNTGK